ncbi:hypothetical protein C8R44DRAFT_746281 [Mycena epipterygia]|nr:hypothetical protein C8R44DRAFT_746281 [Mycena epipterygia]
MYDTPRLPVKRPQQPVPFAVQRRRSKLACVNCKKRKVRYGLSHLMQCIAPKQPTTNPCARCTRRRLTCEYVVSTEDDSSPPANQSPETVNGSYGGQIWQEFPHLEGRTTASYIANLGFPLLMWDVPGGHITGVKQIGMLHAFLHLMGFK